jgi:thiosulfate dehydrogenase (quinone) large subunit
LRLTADYVESRAAKDVGHLMNKHREAAYALLRVTPGVIFLFYGIGKFMGGIDNVADGMQQRFGGKLPSALVLPFAYALPFMEVTFGALILLGLFNSIALEGESRNSRGGSQT